MNKLEPIEAAKLLLNEKFQDAEVVILSGSTVRGDATETSDLDIVVIYKKLECARRESFNYQEWPVEVFIHDLETLKYFFEEVDKPSRNPSLPQMVKEGVSVTPENETLKIAKKMAEEFFEIGPPKASTEKLNNCRYGISDLVEDLKSTRNDNELIAIGVRLFDVLSEYLFQRNDSWSGKGKWVSRKLLEIDKCLEKNFFDSFNVLFESKNPTEVISFVTEVLKSDGGYLFEGHNLDAPKDWRMTIED